MAIIGIPNQVFPGIKLISKFSDSQIQILVKYLNELPIDKRFETVEGDLNKLLEIKNGDNLLQAILSFSNLIEKENDENEEVAINLAVSYIELSGDKLNEKDREILISNLFLVLNNFSSINAILNSRRAYSENENNLRETNLITDLRLIFKDDVDDKNRAAIVLHKLHLEYRKDGFNTDLYLTLDLNDLNNLKVQIEKAILKDQIIREDYKEILKFIF